MSAGSVKQDAVGWYYVADVPSKDGRRKQLRRRRAQGSKENFKTKTEAKSELTRVLGEIQRDEYVQPDKLTVAKYLRDWLDGLPVKGRRESTIDGYRRTIEYNVIPTLGAVKLQALTATQLDALYSALLARGLGRKSVRNIHGVIGKALSDAERLELVQRNVARRATAPSVSSARAPEMTVWTPTQLRDFLVKIHDHAHYPLIHLAAMTGMRRGELVALRWSDVDLDGGTVSVKRSTTAVQGRVVSGDVKTPRSRRVIDIDPTTVAMLRHWRKTQIEYRMLMGRGWRDTGLVFTDPTGVGWHPDTVSQAFDRLVTPNRSHANALLWPRIRFHDLRHSHATHLLAAGVNVKVVSERLGHASVAFTLDVYAHTMPGQQADAAAAVASLVGIL